MPRPRKDAQAERMYDLYLEGYSLGQVALTWGVTRQSVYDVFKRRGYQLRVRRFLPTVEYRGDKYAPDPDGYYRKTSGDRAWLHQVVWSDHNGPIPPGYDIHHLDTNKANNDPSNLVCLTPSEHAAVHNPYLAAPERACSWCRKPLTRKPQPSGRLETPAEVQRRRYCDTACQSAHKRGKPKGWGPRHDETSSL
jgi:hypothetical protein